MKIAMVIPTWGNQCGIAEYTKELMDSIKDKTIQFELVTSPAKIGSNVDLVHFQYEYSLYSIETLNKVMKIIKRRRIPIITTLHTWSKESKFRYYNFVISRRSSMIIVHSEEMKNQCISQGFRREKIVVIPMGCQSFKLDSIKIAKTKNRIDGTPSIGFFGFPFPHKGIKNLIIALNHLKSAYPNIKGYFLSQYPDYLGENHPYYPFVKDLENDFNSNEHLIWIKEYLPKTKIVEILQGMDVNILPYSYHSQQGTSAAVKMLIAAQRPVITTKYLYFADLDNEVIKMNSEDPITISETLKLVLRNEKMQKQLINNGQQYLEDKSWSKIGQKYSHFYRRFQR